MVVAMNDGPPGCDGVDGGAAVSEVEGAAAGFYHSGWRGHVLHLGVGKPKVLRHAVLALRLPGFKG